MFTMIQSAKNPQKRDIIHLANGAYVAPSGNVVGEYRTVFPSLTRNGALKVLAAHFQAGNPVSLWWTGAHADIAAQISAKIKVTND